MTGELEREQIDHIYFNKGSQISAPSHRQILDILKEQVDRVDRVRTLNGYRITQQVYLNCIVVGLERLGPEAVKAIFDLGGKIVGPALLAKEPGTPPEAGRALKKTIAHLADESPVEVTIEERPKSRHAAVDKPLPAVKLPLKGFDSSGGVDRKDEPIIVRKGRPPGRK